MHVKHSRPSRTLAVASAALLLLQIGLASADGVRPDRATPSQREQAQSRFLRGREMMEKNKYDEALVELRLSRDVVASPNTQLEIARCLRAQGRLRDAYTELGRTAEEAKDLAAQDHRYQRAYDAARSERAELEGQLGFLTVTIENAVGSTRVTVGDEELAAPRRSEPVPMAAGAVDVLVETPGKEPIKRTIRVLVGQRASLTIDAKSRDLAEPSPAPAGSSEAPPATAGADGRPPPWMRTGAYVACGLAASGVATFTVFGLVARSTYDHLDGVCAGGPCSADKAGEIASGKSNQSIANVGLAVGLVGAAAGATMFVLSIPRGNDARGHSSSGADFVVSPGSFGLRGAF